MERCDRPVGVALFGGERQVPVRQRAGAEGKVGVHTITRRVGNARSVKKAHE